MGARRIRCLALAALACSAVVTAACGGDSTPAPPGSATNPLVSQQAHQIPGSAPATAAGRSNEAAAAPSAAGAKPTYDQLLRDQSRHPQTRFTPCNLVTRDQAGAIVGSAMREPVEAAQGPTCVYRSSDGRSFVTVAVQTLDFDKVRPHLKLPRRVAVSARTAWCGTYGQPVLYLPLSGGRVLTVGAQCAVAKRFAATAVRQLSR